MSKKVWNLIAAVLCTLGSTACGLGAALDQHNVVNIVVMIGCGLGALGGVAWIIAATQDL